MKKNRTLKLLVIFVLAGLGLKFSQEYHLTMLTGLCASVLLVTALMTFIPNNKKK